MHELLRTLIKQFMPYAKEKIGFKHPPRLFLRQDAKNAANPLGKTAFYDPQAKSVTIYTTNRHPKDVMRSLSHELVHHKQNCDGQFDHVGEMGEGYAQNDDHLRGMEREAYEVGNLCFRDWEDSIKGTIYNEHLLKGVNNTMSTKNWKNKELKTLLSEAWGFKMNLAALNEDKSAGFHACASHVKEIKTGREGRCINHTLTETNEVTHYTVEFDTEIVENIPLRALTVLKEGHHSHPGNRSDYPYDEEKPRCPFQDDEEGEHEDEETDVEELAAKAMEAIHDLAAAAGVDAKSVESVHTDVEEEEDDEEELEERRARGRKGPHIRGNPDPRLREEKVRQLIRNSLKNIKERRNK